MIWGDGLSNIGFTGSRTIDGGGHFITGNPKTGQADKLIALTRCDSLVDVSGVRYLRMQGVARATQYGYSIYELQAYPLA